MTWRFLFHFQFWYTVFASVSVLLSIISLANCFFLSILFTLSLFPPIALSISSSFSCSRFVSFLFLSFALGHITAVKQNATRTKTSYDLTTEWENSKNGVQSKRQRCKRKIMSVANFYSCKFLSLPKKLCANEKMRARKRSERRNKMWWQLQEMRLELKKKTSTELKE